MSVWNFPCRNRCVCVKKKLYTNNSADALCFPAVLRFGLNFPVMAPKLDIILIFILKKKPSWHTSLCFDSNDYFFFFFFFFSSFSTTFCIRELLAWFHIRILYIYICIFFPIDDIGAPLKLNNKPRPNPSSFLNSFCRTALCGFALDVRESCEVEVPPSCKYRCLSRWNSPAGSHPVRLESKCIYCSCSTPKLSPVPRPLVSPSWLIY